MGIKSLQAARPWAPIVGVLIAGLAGTGFVTGLLWERAQQSDQRQFDALAHFIRERLDDRVEKYEQALALIRELFNYTPLPTQIQWRQMLDRLKLPVNCRGLVQFGYAPYLTRDQGEQPSPELLQAGGANIRLAPSWPPERPILPVLYTSGKQASGSNSFEQSLNRPSLEPAVFNARDRNAVSTTRRLSLDLPESQGNGFYLLQPVYKPDVPVDALVPEEDSTAAFRRMVRQRSGHFQGVVFGAIQMDMLLKEMLEEVVLEVAFEIFDGQKLQESLRLNDRWAAPTPLDRVRRLDLTNRVLSWPMYGDRWSIVFYPTVEFERHSPRRNIWMVSTAGIVATFCFAGVVWVQLRRRYASELHSREMLEARDVIDSLSQEQEQIRRDLHDGVLQSLYALGLGMQKARRATVRNPNLAEQLARQNLEALELSMGELRRHLKRRGSEAPEDLDLEPALRNLASFMDRQGRIPVRFSHQGEGWRPSGSVVLQLLQIAREAIINAQRHSEANLVLVQLHWRMDGVEMMISDDGVGFDSGRSGVQSYGLRNMADRAAGLDAVFRLDSHPGQGTRVIVQAARVPSGKMGPGSERASEANSYDEK